MKAAFKQVMRSIFNRETVESLIIAFVLAMIIRTFIVQAFKIPTGSMMPTLQVGDRILVCKFLYWFREPEQGEIIVFKYPEDPKLDYIKRLIATSGQKVRITNGKIYIDEEPVTNSRICSHFYYNRGAYGDPNLPIVVPEESYFVLGDNSGNSRDSRYWGFVPKRNLVGKAILVYWPLTRLRLIK